MISLVAALRDQRASAMRRRVVALVGCMLMVATGAGAQEVPGADASFVLPGRVIGPLGEALAGQEVVLHRIAGGVGGTVATDTTDADGRFVLETEAGAPDATYFAAGRYLGELYIAPPFQPPLPAGIDYTLQVGVPETSAAELMGGGSAAQPPPVLPGRTEPFPYMWWVFLVVPLLVVALVAGYMLTRRRTPRTRRRLLVEIAELDEAHDAELAAGHVEDSMLYWAERRVLLEQLTHTS